MSTTQRLENEFPLHWAVFRKDYEELMAALEADSSSEIVNKLDCRGRTPLMLAITLGHVQCAKALLEKGADASIQNEDMWSPVQEAICSGNAELLKIVMQYHHYQRAMRTSRAMERLLRHLSETNDFYAEMSWEFASWIPFVSKMCPSDTYKIFKRGSNVRIDTTLVGFDSSSNWKRGNQSFIFRYSDDNHAQMIVLDHISRTATISTIDTATVTDVNDFIPQDDVIYWRMMTPVDTTYVDIEKIGFERSRKGGLFSWLTSSEHLDDVDGCKCKVFNASNVEIVTKTRTEHLSEEDKERFRKEERDNPLHKILKLVEKREECTAEMKDTGGDVYCSLTPQQYLDSSYVMGNRDIGHSKQVMKKSNSFKATIWLSDQYPLDLQDQILPIIDLMAVNNSHFARLKNFIQLQLPAGFPVKIEIPLFHVVSARITFSNVNKLGPHVTLDQAEKKVEIDATVFDVPSHYHLLTGDDLGIDPTQSIGTSGGSVPARYIPEDELYLQFALEQSMREAAGLPTSSSLYNVVTTQSDEDPDLAYAIAESLRTLRLDRVMREGSSPESQAVDEDLELAIKLSQQEHEERLKSEKEHEAELEQILKLSLVEK